MNGRLENIAPVGEEVMGRYVVCRHEHICSFYSSPRLIKSWINWVGQVACMGDAINSHILVILAGRPGGIRPVTRPVGYHTQTALGNRDM